MSSGRYARAMSVVALVLVSATAAWAASLPSGSVRSATIKNGQVKTRDLARKAINGARVANGSLTATVLAKGVARRGLKGAPGGPGRAGVDGGVGPAAVDDRAVGLLAPVDIDAGASVLIGLNPGAYTAEPGTMALFAARVTLDHPSGTCAGTENLAVTLFAGRVAVGLASATAPGEVILSSSGAIDIAGSGTIPIVMRATNYCSGTWHVAAARVDVVHVN